jgi:membrane associated rhomboid family serine protease
MGIHDRDYYRDRSEGFLDGWGPAGATLWLIVISCVVFFGQLVTGDPLRNPLTAFGIYLPDRVLAGQLWRLLTPVFLHADLLHLLLNMIVLFWAGKRVEEVYGKWEFLAFFLGGGVFTHALYLLAYVAGLAPAAVFLGASGAVSATLVLLACNFPRMKVLLFFVIPMPVWLLAVFYVLIDALGAVMALTAPAAFLVPLSGAFVGAIYYVTGIRLTRILSRIFGRSARDSDRPARARLRLVPALKPAEPPTPLPTSKGTDGSADHGGSKATPAALNGEGNLEARLDQVLEKVARHGQASLTPEEREVLFKASELYRRRRK